LSADAYFLPAGIYTLYILQNTVPDNYGLRNYYKRGGVQYFKGSIIQTKNVNYTGYAQKIIFTDVPFCFVLLSDTVNKNFRK
jgi:hypothetical protein